MGLLRDGFPGHEGHAVGFVLRDGVSPDSGIYRELAYPEDKSERKVDLIAAGCECGWRSPRWKPIKPATWSPYTLSESEEDEERVHALWSEHLEELSRRQAAGKGSSSPPPPRSPQAAPRPAPPAGADRPVEPPKGPPTCHFCGLPLWEGPTNPDRNTIEAHLASHKPLTPCLGRRDGCENMTNAFETSSPGYCLECEQNPKWMEIGEGHLELVSEGADGLRHSLAGRAVHAGDTLELKLSDGTWLLGRYEWDFHGDSLATFHVGLAGEPVNSERDEGAIRIQNWAILRWPPRS